MTVFLGGTCNPTTWRTDLAIPMLKNLGITYYNPQVEAWKPELIELEWSAKEKADVLFFVIDNETRAIVVMIEVAFIAGSQRKPALVLVVNDAKPTSCIFGETISEREFQELRQSQSYLQEMVERQGIPIFDQIPVALTCVARVLHNGSSPQEKCCEDSAVSVRSTHSDLSDREVRLRQVFDSLDNHNSGAISLNDLRLALRILTGRELSSNSIRQIVIGQMNGQFKTDSDLRTKNLDDIRVSFNEFCCIVNKSELSTNICEDLAKKLETIAQPVNRLFEWFLKPSKTAINSANSAPHMPYDAHYCDIYLGGSSSPSNPWRDDIAIPLLRKHGLSYYCSQNESLSEDRIIPIESAAIEKSRVLLFVVTNDSRALSAMISAAHYVALGCNAVLCIQYLNEESVIDGVKLTDTAIKDYNRGRAYLSDMASRSCVPVYEDIREAVISCVHKCFLSDVLMNKKSSR